MFGLSLKTISGLLFGSLALGGTACQEPRSMEDLKAEIRRKFPDVSQIGVESFDRLRQDGEDGELEILDVRQPKEFAVSHLLGALPAPDLNAALKILAGQPLDRPVVVYCSVGYRSSALATQLQERGYSNVRNLEGSLFEWANRGLPVVRDGVEVKEVHPYDRLWGRFLKSDLWAFEAGESSGSR